MDVWALCLLIERAPKLFRLLLKAANLLKRLGVAKLVAKTGLLKLFGLGAMQEAALGVDEAPLTFLREHTDLDPDLKTDSPEWLFFSACGTEFLFPEVGLASLRVLNKIHGAGAAFGGGCCGLVAYNYGEIETARRMAKSLIERAEESDTSVPIVADCSSCAAHLKSYPQLFLNDSEMRSRAERFQARVKDILELLPADKIPALEDPVQTAHHDSCRARHGQSISKEPRECLGNLCGDSTKELPEADSCCGGAGAFAFTQPELSDDVLRRKISAAASSQTRTLTASSTSCLVQLARGRDLYYPEVRVAHLVELVDKALSEQKNDG